MSKYRNKRTKNKRRHTKRKYRKNRKKRTKKKALRKSRRHKSRHRKSRRRTKRGKKGGVWHCSDSIDCNDYADKKSKMRSGARSIVYDCNEKKEHCKPEGGKKVICVAAINSEKYAEEKEGYKIQKEIYNLALESGGFDKSDIPIPEISKCGVCKRTFNWEDKDENEDKEEFDDGFGWLEELGNSKSSFNPPFKIEENILGGELQDIIHKKRMKIPEDEIKRLFYPIFKILELMHVNGIAHRDIKPTNILIQLKDVDDQKMGDEQLKEVDDQEKGDEQGKVIDDIRIEQIGSLKLIDFGYTQKKGIENEEGFTKLYGTPQYIPPEILKCNNGRGDKGGNNLFYNEQCDMFSLGVVLFECFTGGTPPFIFSPEYLHADDENKNTYYEEIRNFEQDKSKTGFTKKHIQSASEEFKDILKGLLKEIPKERITASEALQHAFFKT